MVAPASLVFPAGSLLDYAGGSIPDGWLACDGAAVSRTTYAALFSAIGTTYGTGDGSTTFNLPDFRGRMSIGVGNGTATGHTNHTRGQAGGEETHVLTEAEMPSHTHNRGTIYTGASAANPGTRLASASASVFYANNGSGYTADSGGTGATGGGQAHNTMSPYLTVNKMIATGPTSTTPAEPAPGEVLVEAAVWEPGQSMWDFLQPLVQSIGKRLWCDEQRQWHLTDPSDGSAGGLVLSAANSVTHATDLIDREREWFDAVVITYEWRDAAGADHVRYDTAYLPGWSKVYQVTYERPYPGAGAAAAILARAKGRGRRVGIEAMNDYQATPGQAATISLADTPTQTGLVASVTWRLPDNEMRVTTRDLIDTPPHSWIATVGGVAWEDIAVGTDWTEYVEA